MQPVSIMLNDTVMGDTSLGQDNISAPCQVGSDSEIVYEFVAPASGTVGFTLTSDADLGLNVRTACADNSSVIACVDDNFGVGAMETVNFTVTNGMTYYVVVDGYDTGEAGTFTLTVDAAIAQEVCNNMMDDNGNTLVDCEEASCVMDAACSGPIAAACTGATPITPGTQQMGDTTGGSNLFAGTCTGFGSAEQLYSYTPAQDQVMTVVMQSASDQGMVFRTTCGDPSSQLGCVDAQGGGTDEVARHLFLAGATPITMVVDGFMAGEEGPYTFTANTANINEVEPNNDYLTANTFATGFLGYINSGDTDFIAVTTNQMGNLTVSAVDVFAGDCANSQIDTEIELFDTDGMTSLGMNDDIDAANGNYCSTFTANNLPAGTYFVRVSASQAFCAACVMGYTLDVVAQ